MKSEGGVVKSPEFVAKLDRSASSLETWDLQMVSGERQVLWDWTLNLRGLHQLWVVTVRNEL